MPTAAPIRVMIVDDHPVTRSSLKLLLFFEPDMVVVGTATCITEAFALAPQVQPEVVLMDVQLPDGDGITAAKQLQSTLPTTHVILMSVQPDHPGLQPALQAGRWTFLLKPVEAQTLYHAIRNAVGPHLPRTVVADQTARDRPTDPAHDAPESLPTPPPLPPAAAQPAPTYDRVRAYQLIRQRLLANLQDVQA
jgi:DNA-binding NarL/FixJ family response regulator